MLANIPQSRLLLYFLILAILPFLWVCFDIWQDDAEIQDLRQRIERIDEKAALRNTKQSTNMAVIDAYKKADNFYIDKQLEKLHLLEPEVEGLQKIMNNKAFPEDEEVRRRYEQLSGPANTLSFNEGAVVRYPLFKEVVESQVRPVEVNLNDIARILTLIEGIPVGQNTVPPNRPQLIILEFRLDKKRVNEDNETFILNTRLLKREFL